METGFDALAHAIESYLSKRANLHSENLSLQAIRLIGENLPKLNQNLDDHEAREKVSYASMLMGMNLYNVGNCLPHRMQYPIGALTGTSHAAGLAALYPVWIGEEYKVVPHKVENIFKNMAGKIPHTPIEAREIMVCFLTKLGIYKTLNDLGISKEKGPLLVDKISGNLSVDPIGTEENICRKIYQESC